mmetsp:Transcript_24513/g.70749  ORF Transcript_24513/g.70749 Transcript_24513/m.70749 type:complete len:105 (-) Transcript_24513:162-476(-)
MVHGIEGKDLSTNIKCSQRCDMWAEDTIYGQRHGNTESDMGQIISIFVRALLHSQQVPPTPRTDLLLMGLYVAPESRETLLPFLLSWTAWIKWLRVGMDGCERE